MDVIAIKLDAFAKLLDLTPYKGGCKCNNGKLKPISHQEIQPVLAICPNSVNTCSDHYYISINGRYLTYFINPQWHLPTTQKKRVKGSIAVKPGLVRISNRVL